MANRYPYELTKIPSTEEILAGITNDMLAEALLFPRIYTEFRKYLRIEQNVERLQALQQKRLAGILLHAVQYVPAYRNLSMATDQIVESPVEALARFPFVTKSELRDELVDHCDDNISPALCKFSATSGTTGIPLKIIHHRNHTIQAAAIALRRYHSYGLEFGAKFLQPIRRIQVRDWFEYTSPAWGLARVAEFGLSENDVDQRRGMLDHVLYFQPDLIREHPSNCVTLMNLLGEANRGKIRPRAIMCFGEHLISSVRQALEDYFAAPVYDAYGMREVNTIAAECRMHNYHIESERIWVEVIDDEGRVLTDGEVGEIVVTNMTNTAMPFIRYKTGDIGSLAGGLCSCGKPHRMMKLLEGRRASKIALPGGRHALVMPIMHIICRSPIERFQIIQNNLAELSVYVKLLPGAESVDLRTMEREISGSLHGEIEVRVNKATDNMFASLGKRKAVDFISYVDGPINTSGDVP